MNKIQNIENYSSDEIFKIQHPFVFFIFFIGLFAVSLISKNLIPFACDIAEYINNPVRIINGELPYKDFWLLFPPGEVYFPALIYKIFGIDTDILRLFTIFFSCLSAVFAFFLSKLFLHKERWSYLLTAVYFFASIIYLYEGPDYINMYLMFLVVSVIFLLLYFRSGKALSLFYSGMAIAAAFFFKFYETGSLFAAIAIAIALHWYFNKNKIEKPFKLFASFFLGFSLVIGIIFIAFADILPLALHEIIFESVDNGTGMNLPYYFDTCLVFDSLKQDISALQEGFGISGMFNFTFHFIKIFPVTLYYLLPFIAVIIFIFYLLQKPAKQQIIIASLFFFWGMFSFPKGLGRSDLSHLAPAFIPLTFFIFYIFFNFRKEQSSNKIFWKINHYASLLIIITMSFTLIFPLSKMSYLAGNKLYYAETPNGDVAFKKYEDYSDFQNLVNFLKINTKPKDNFFVTLWGAPPLYALFDLKNPTYFDSLNDLLVRHSTEKQQKICADLQKTKTKYIIHHPDWGYDDKQEQTFQNACPLLNEFINTNYTICADFGTYKVYKLKE